MAVKKTRRGTRKTVAKKPAAKKVLSAKAQKRNRVVKKIPVKNMAQIKKIANKAAPKKTSARKKGSKKLILSAKNQKINEKLYKMSDKKAAKYAAAVETASKKTSAKKTSAKKIPKGRIGLLAAGIGTVIGGTAALRNKPKSFGEAFKKARKSKGPNSTFTYKGKKYSTVTKDQIKKAGFTNLRDYLNSKKKK